MSNQPPGQPNPYGQPAPNPYAHPQQQAYTQPLWQGHQAPQQAPGQQAWQTQQYAASSPKSSKGLLIGLVALLVLLLVGAGLTAAVLFTGGDDPSSVAVSNLDEGDCITSGDLANVNGAISDIETTDCHGDHDAEVFAVLEREKGEDLTAAGTHCVEAADEKGHSLTDLQADGLEIRPLVAGDDPEEVDDLVCFIRSPEGEPLTEPTFAE